METRNIYLTLEEAREWYNSNNESLKEIALKAFTKEELNNSFRNIKSFKDACKALNLCYNDAIFIVNYTSKISKASAAMFKLNIIRTALNLDYDLNLTENPKNTNICFPYNPFITKDSTYYDYQLNSGKMEIIGKIKSEGEEYNVLGGGTNSCGYSGLSNFDSMFGISFANTCTGFLGCATEEIAQHFGKYFGMLITVAKYGDLPDFEIIENKY